MLAWFIHEPLITTSNFWINYLTTCLMTQIFRYNDDKVVRTRAFKATGIASAEHKSEIHSSNECPLRMAPQCIFNVCNYIVYISDFVNRLFSKLEKLKSSSINPMGLSDAYIRQWTDSVEVIYFRWNTFRNKPQIKFSWKHEQFVAKIFVYKIMVTLLQL